MEEDNTVSSELLLPSGLVVYVIGGMTSCVVLMTGILHPSHSCSSTAAIVTGSVFLIGGQDVRSNTAALGHSSPMGTATPPLLHRHPTSILSSRKDRYGTGC